MLGRGGASRRVLPTEGGVPRGGNVRRLSFQCNRRNRRGGMCWAWGDYTPMLICHCAQQRDNSCDKKDRRSVDSAGLILVVIYLLASVDGAPSLCLNLRWGLADFWREPLRGNLHKAKQYHQWLFLQRPKILV